MDWEQLAVIAQIATGVATLAVAVVLMRQIRLQGQTLDLAHKDAEREILYTSNLQYLLLNQNVMDPWFGPIWRKGTLDYDSLDEDEEVAFRNWNRIQMINSAVDFQTGQNSLVGGTENRLKTAARMGWSDWPGMATYYERYGREHTYDKQLRSIYDEVFIETQGRKVIDNWRLTVKNDARQK